MIILLLKYQLNSFCLFLLLFLLIKRW